MLGSAPTGLVVLLASVLKPVDDTRMREKFAETLRARAGTAVHIAGRGTGPRVAQGAAGASSITLHPIFHSSRLSLGRLAAQGRYWCLLRVLHPDFLIVHAPELLPLTLLWQALGRGRKFIYDIRENYALNVSTQGVYQGLTRRGLAAGLRWVEALAAKRAAAVMLAEESYAAELPFLSELRAEQVVILENKYQPPPGQTLPRQPRFLPEIHEPLRLLFSGTISVLNGVWEAIALAGQLRRTWPGGAQLTIIGFCQQPALLHELQAKAAAEASWLRLVGGAEPVPHARIVAEISQSHLGLLPYRPHPSTERCRPTKLFEYLAHGLPVLYPPNPLWRALVQQHNAGLETSFDPSEAEALTIALRSTRFYPAGVPADVLWTSEGEKLQRLLDSLV